MSLGIALRFRVLLCSAFAETCFEASAPGQRIVWDLGAQSSNINISFISENSAARVHLADTSTTAWAAANASVRRLDAAGVPPVGKPTGGTLRSLAASAAAMPQVGHPTEAKKDGASPDSRRLEPMLMLDQTPTAVPSASAPADEASRSEHAMFLLDNSDIFDTFQRRDSSAEPSVGHSLDDAVFGDDVGGQPRFLSVPSSFTSCSGTVRAGVRTLLQCAGLFISSRGGREGSGVRVGVLVTPTFQGSFSAVSKMNFATSYLFCNNFQDLEDRYAYDAASHAF